MEAASNRTFIATMNNSTDDSSPGYWFIGILLPVGIFGMITNTLLIITLLRHPKPITPYQCILLGSSGCNLFFSCLSFNILANILHPPTTTFACKIFPVLRYFTRMQTFYTDTLLAFVRYRASKRLVSRPVQLMTWKQFLILYTLITALNISLTTARGVSDSYAYNKVLNAYSFVPPGERFPIHWLDFGAFCTTLVLTCSWYGIIYHGLRTNKFQGCVHRRVEKCVSRNMIMVVVLYSLTSLAVLVSKIFESRNRIALEIIAAINPVINNLLSSVSPLLQGIKIDEVKKVLQNCPCSQNKIGVVPKIPALSQDIGLRSSHIALEECTTVCNKAEGQTSRRKPATPKIFSAPARHAFSTYHI